jgi:hypothetical protein
VPSSPGLWPDCLERFLQFEAVVFYECKTDRPRSQPSHRTGSVRTIFLQDVISSLQTSAPEEFHASPECHPSPSRTRMPSVLPEPSRQCGAERGKALHYRSDTAKLSDRVAWARQFGGRTVLGIGIDWALVINVCSSSSRNGLLHLHLHVHGRLSKHSGCFSRRCWRHSLGMRSG